MKSNWRFIAYHHVCFFASVISSFGFFVPLSWLLFFAIFFHYIALVFLPYFLTNYSEE